MNLVNGEKMKKKILFMLSTMNIGGIEKSFLSLVSRLKPEKYDITLLLLEKKGGFLESIPSYVKVEECQWFKEIKSILMNSPYDIIKQYKFEKKYLKIISFIYSYYMTKFSQNRVYYFKEMMKDIKIEEIEYDIAIAYAGPTEIIDYFIVEKVKAKKKIGWMHFDPTKINMNKKLYSYLYRRFNKIFVVSEEGKEKLKDIFKENGYKIKIFKNILNPKLIKKLSEEAIEDIVIEKDTLKIVTLGRLGTEKGQDLGIKALQLLKERGLKVKWYFIGDGLARKEYEELVKKLKLENEVIFLGNKINPYPYLKMADIYVQTSRHEGYCIALAEAKILNKKIVTTNFTGALEQLKNYSFKTICKLYIEDEKIVTELKNNILKIL